MGTLVPKGFVAACFTDQEIRDEYLAAADDQAEDEDISPEEEYTRFGGFSRTKSTYNFEEGSLPARKYSVLMSRPGLRRQFERFSRLGDPGSSGDFITAVQTDKWLKMAGVIDHWNVTTLDAANFFRKISKSVLSTCLCRLFLWYS